MFNSKLLLCDLYFRKHQFISHNGPFVADPNIPVSQHWLIEEAERRRRAEEQGIDRKLPPDVVIPPQNDIQVPQKSLHTRHPNPYPKGFDPEIPTRLPAQRKQQSQEAPASTNAVQRRLRKPEAEAEHQRKLQNRRSLPDLTGGRDNAIPSSRNPNGPQYGSGQVSSQCNLGVYLLLFFLTSTKIITFIILIKMKCKLCKHDSL